jgi:hypothetical protein
MLWKQYVFSRGEAVFELWETLFRKKSTKVLYICGSGFDVRAQAAMKAWVETSQAVGAKVESAKLVLIELDGYQLDAQLQQLTIENTQTLRDIFARIPGSSVSTVRASIANKVGLTAAQALRSAAEAILGQVADQTDIILDVSSMPRVLYLTLMTSVLNRLLSGRKSNEDLAAGGVNFQILVAEDPSLDARIHAEDPSGDPILIPGFSSAVQAESMQEWPLVWLPILGEGKVNQLIQVMRSNLIPDDAEICAILPHPSRNPRRADELLIEYREPLFDSGRAPISNVMYAHESHPFEAYRQVLLAMNRYRQSMSILGGCRLVVTPLGSKLITLGAGLACFEMRPDDVDAKYRVAIPHAEPTRYVAETKDLTSSNPDICSMLLTGEAYSV